jgi:hypothetical protein
MGHPLYTSHPSQERMGAAPQQAVGVQVPTHRRIAMNGAPKESDGAGLFSS